MTNINELPIVLEAKHIVDILGMCNTKVYDLMEAEGFPLIRIGRNKRVMRDRFFEWLENIEEVA